MGLSGTKTDPFYLASPNSIFIVGGAPEAHEGLSKTSWDRVHFGVKVSCPRRFRSGVATIRE